MTPYVDHSNQFMASRFWAMVDGSTAYHGIIMDQRRTAGLTGESLTALEMRERLLAQFLADATPAGTA